MALPPLLWDGVLRRLSGEVPALALEAWIRPLVAEGRGAGLRVVCPTPFHRDRVRERYLGQIADMAALEAGGPLPVTLAVARDAAGGAPPRPPGGTSPEAPPALPQAGALQAVAPPTAAPVQSSPLQSAPVQTALACTFESFVVGPCNALAREAALALARGSQPGVSPLCLVGESGLGKTHLARALVHEARLRGTARAIHASAEGFTSAFMNSIRSRQIGGFKRRYRDECELLVIEDVQFLDGKRATQLEFFHTIEHLLTVGARVVLTADRQPRDLPGFDVRLRSRMTSGLVAEIEPPDARVRRQILRAKAASGGVRLPEACLDRLVEEVRGSVRDLEAVLVQLVASATLLGRPIDDALTEAALRKIAPAAPGATALEPRDVIRNVAAFFGTTPDRMASRSRRRDVLLPRQLAMYLCRRYTNASLQDIGRQLGRDHPAVSNAVTTVERRVLERAPLRYQVEELTSRLETLVRSRTGSG